MTARDPGLQPERTGLAWQRTGLSAAVVAALLLRSGFGRGSVPDVAAGLCLAIAAVVGCAVARHPGRRGASRHAMATTAAAVVAGGVLAVWGLLAE